MRGSGPGRILVFLAITACIASVTPSAHGQSANNPELINTSLLLNGDFTIRADYWDRPFLQYPTRPNYNPSTNRGLNHFKVSNKWLQVEEWGRVQQRILLSPGNNYIQYLRTYFDPIEETWSQIEMKTQVMYNPHATHIMKPLILSGVVDMYNTKVPRKVRYTKVKAQCFTPEVTINEFKNEINSELDFILNLHTKTCTIVSPDSQSLFPHEGLQTNGHFSDYKKLSSFKEYKTSKPSLSPQANLFLRSAKCGIKEYANISYGYAMGVLASLTDYNGYCLPRRYDFQLRKWEDLKPNQNLPLANLLKYLCECADFYGHHDFYKAANRIAEQMVNRNWWNLPDKDPEGLFFISKTHKLEQNGDLEGSAFIRTPLDFPGASVAPDNKDHLMLCGAVAISRYLRLIEENRESLGGELIDETLLLSCSQVLNDTMDSFCRYADKFNKTWISSLTNHNILTAAWPVNYDRRDDYAGYNLGDGMTVILGDGYANHQGWYPRMLSYIEGYRVMWHQNACQGGRDAADSYRFYKSFYHLWQIKECRSWAEQYLVTYLFGLVQMIKGSIHSGYPARVGQWDIWDWEPYGDSPWLGSVTPPQDLFSWSSHVLEMCHGYQKLKEQERLIVTTISSVLKMIQAESRGDAGYPANLNEPTSTVGGGELRFSTGLFDMLDALNRLSADIGEIPATNEINHSYR